MSFTMRDSMTGRINVLAAAAAINAYEAMEEYADIIRDYAQENAPWNDRTGEARAGLDTNVEQVQGEIVLELFHTAEHGQWLETVQSGRWAIIMPTLELFAADAFEAAGGKLMGEDL